MLSDIEAVWPTAFYLCCRYMCGRPQLGLIHQAVLLSLKIR